MSNPFTIDAMASQLQITFTSLLWAIVVRLVFDINPYKQTYLFATICGAGVVFLLKFPPWLSRRIAFGSARPVGKDEDQVIVITGGSGGLGRVMADMFASKGARVAILDVTPFYDPKAEEHEDDSNIKWYECDVGNVDSVMHAQALIQKDLGTPTVLINNAGIVNGHLLLSLGPQSLERNFRINLLSHYFTVQAFLPGMLGRPEGGTIVTVSSVLGHLGASHLSDYTAAKAGLIAMHASLNAELAFLKSGVQPPRGADNIRTILVKPGQLSTPLFRGVKTPSNFFGRVVEPAELAADIVKMVCNGESGVIAAPLYARWIELLGVLPYGLQRIARAMSGVDRAMAGFGNTKEVSSPE